MLRADGWCIRPLYIYIGRGKILGFVCRETSNFSILSFSLQKLFFLLLKESSLEEEQQLFPRSLIHVLNTRLLLRHSANVCTEFNTTCNFPSFTVFPLIQSLLTLLLLWGQRGSPWGALKPVLLIAFHRSTRGRLETAGAVIAFFMQPSADWPAANQRLVYTR